MHPSLCSFHDDNNNVFPAFYSPWACIYYALYTVPCNGCCAPKQTVSLWVQVFMIPGAMFINVLAGSLYGLWGTFCVIACVSTLGAGLNYWLARLLVRVTLCSGCLHMCQYWQLAKLASAHNLQFTLSQIGMHDAHLAVWLNTTGSSASHGPKEQCVSQCLSRAWVHCHKAMCWFS